MKLKYFLEDLREAAVTVLSFWRVLVYEMIAVVILFAPLIAVIAAIAWYVGAP